MSIKTFIIALTLTALSMPALAANIHMLPPIQSNTTDEICQEGEGNKLLTWNGADAIKCNKDVMLDDNYNMGVGTDSPKAKLHVNGAMKIGKDFHWCCPSHKGLMEWDNGTLEYCDGTKEVKLIIPDFTCPKGEAIRSAVNGEVVCTTSVKRHVDTITNISAICKDPAGPDPNPWTHPAGSFKRTYETIRWTNTCGARYCINLDQGYVTGKISEYGGGNGVVDCW